MVKHWWDTDDEGQTRPNQIPLPPTRLITQADKEQAEREQVERERKEADRQVERIIQGAEEHYPAPTDEQIAQSHELQAYYLAVYGFIPPEGQR